MFCSYVQVLVRNILNIEDFLESDLLGDKHPIKITAGALEPGECTDSPPTALGELPLSQEYVAAVQVLAMSSLYENECFPFPSTDYTSNSPIAEEALSDRMQTLVQPPQEEEVTSQLSKFHNPEAFSLCLGEGLHLVEAPLMVCEGDYILSSNLTETSPLGGSCV